MAQKRSSRIWLASTEEVREAVEQSHSSTQALQKLGIFYAGSSIPTLRKRCAEDGIDLSKFVRGQASNKGKKLGPHKNKIPDEKLFVANSNTSRGVVRRRLVLDKQIPYVCVGCGLLPEWKGEKMALVLDHINGINNDHRLENLRFLCPNCNSQTSTFAGRNLTCVGTGHISCTQCAKKILKRNISGLCGICYKNNRSADVEHPSRVGARKVIDRPSKEELQKLPQENTWTAVGRKYGVNGNSVRKWAKGYGLPTKKEKIIRICSKCPKEIPKKRLNASGLCRSCFDVHVLGNPNHPANIARRVVKNRPSKEELAALRSTHTWKAIGDKYGVTAATISYWAKGYGLPAKKPKRIQ